MKKFLSLIFSLLLFASVTNAQQTADVTITLNEKFFDALLDAVFTNLQNPSFPIAELQEDEKKRKSRKWSLHFRMKILIISDISFLKSNFETENRQSKSQCKCKL